MMFFLPFIQQHTWLAPLSHFTSSAIAGGVAYYITTKEFRIRNSIFQLFNDKSALAFSIFIGIATHIFFDFLGWF